MNTTRTYFLDTNALHYLYTYIRASIAQGCSPLDISSVDAVSTGDLPDVKNTYSKAHRLLEHWSQGESEVLYSGLAFVELMAGLIRGKAVVQAANRFPLPYRRWQKFETATVNSLVDHSGLLSIHQDYRTVEEWIDQNLAIRFQPYHDDRAVLDVAHHLLDECYLEPIDCIIYASALSVRADYLVSYDKGLQNIVRWIAAPGQAPPLLQDRFQGIHDRLVEYLGLNNPHIPVRQSLPAVYNS